MRWLNSRCDWVSLTCSSSSSLSCACSCAFSDHSGNISGVRLLMWGHCRICFCGCREGAACVLVHQPTWQRGSLTIKWLCAVLHIPALYCQNKSVLVEVLPFRFYCSRCRIAAASSERLKYPCCHLFLICIWPSAKRPHEGLWC